MSQGIAEGRFTKLHAKRGAHLKRCIECAELTIPALLTDEGVDENTPLKTPYQGLGARAVNNLAAKLLITLFPPNTPFFRYDIDAQTLEELKESMGEEDLKTQVNAKLRMIETMIVKYIEACALRVQMYRALRLLIATGNTLIEVLKSGKLKVYRLDKYVVRRNPSGEVAEIIIKELITWDEVPEGIQVEAQLQAPGEKLDEKDDIGLYTRIVLEDDGQYHTNQECLGVEVPESDGAYPPEKLPFRALTWTLADGENYGRGHVEEHIGDFISYDSLNQSLLEAAAAAAKVIYLINPNGTTSADDLRTTPNGGFAIGREEDIGKLALDKYYDLKTAYEQTTEIEGRLSRAFLLHESVQRQAERVTAEEIRYLAQELEDALGGIYSVLGLELQQPLVVLYTDHMLAKKKLPAMPEGLEPTIITGFEALGRGHELDKLRVLKQELAEFGPEVVVKYIKMTNYVSRVCTAIGIDPDGLVPTKEEIEQQERQEQMMAQLQEMLKTGAATEMTKGVMQQGQAQGAE